MSATDDKLVMQGIVEESIHGTFKVQCEHNHIALCTLSGKLRTNKIRVLVGDKVTIEMSVYDTSKGRIVFRH